MSKLDKKLADPMVRKYLDQHRIMSCIDFNGIGLYSYDIKKLIERGLIKRMERGKYQVVKSDLGEDLLQEKSSSSFEEIKHNFEQKDIPGLYRSFQNIELNEETIKNLYPLLLSGLINLQKEIESLKKGVSVESKEEIVEEVKEPEEKIEEKIHPETIEKIQKEKTEIKEVVKEELEEEIEEEKPLSQEELESIYQAYLDAVNYNDFESAHQYIKAYIKECTSQNMIGPYYYNLFGIEKKLYENNYSRITLEERKALENQVRQFLKKNCIEEAQECYDKLLELDQEKNPYYDFFYIKILRRQRRFPKAIEVGKQLCENFPHYAKSYYELALSQFMHRQVSKDETIKTLEKYFQYDMGEHYNGDVLLINCYMHLEKYEKAEEALIEAENYLKPDLLPSFYQKVLLNKENYLEQLKKKIDQKAGDFSDFLVSKLQMHYEKTSNLFEKIEGIPETNYAEMQNEKEQKESYMDSFNNCFCESKNVEAIYSYIDSLDLDMMQEMEVKLIASEFFAKEKLYSASKKCFQEVEKYKGKDSYLKEQVEDTRRELRLIKARNK